MEVFFDQSDVIQSECRFAIDYWDGWVRPENTSGLETVECTEFEYDETLFQVENHLSFPGQVFFLLFVLCRTPRRSGSTWSARGGT